MKKTTAKSKLKRFVRPCCRIRLRNLMDGEVQLQSPLHDLIEIVQRIDARLCAIERHIRRQPIYGQTSNL